MPLSDFEKLTDFQNLYNSMKAAMKGCKKNSHVAAFYRNALENILCIKRDLLSHSYTISPYTTFVVTEPKRRVIQSGAFRDKVLQHCLCDYVLLPKLTSVFIQDNYAGQIGKGTLFGLRRLSEHLITHYSSCGFRGYILKCDISKFYYSIKHDVMKDIVAKYFDDADIRWVCNLIIDSTDGDGLPLGNQTSQVFALMYLASLDELVTDTLGFNLYGRYSDDFFVISDDKTRLKNALSEISDHLSTIGLELNNKTEILPIRRGIKFVGFHVYLTQDGRVVKRVCGDKKRAEIKKIRKCARLVAEGKMPRKKFDEILTSIRNHLSHGDCLDVISVIDHIVCGILQ